MCRTPAGIDDPWQVRDAAVPLATRRDSVFDPVTLERVPLERSRGGATFSVRFEPGEGDFASPGTTPPSLPPGRGGSDRGGACNRAGMGGIYRPVHLVCAAAKLAVGTMLELVRR